MTGIPSFLLMALAAATKTNAWVPMGSHVPRYKVLVHRVGLSNIDSCSHAVDAPVPEIKWTVPGMKRGWQDNDGNWWDEDGPRSGPPLNYWRQQADERAFQKDTTVIHQVLDCKSLDKVEDIMLSLTLQVSNPLLNSKILGVWAPLVRNGSRVGKKHPSANALLEVPYAITTARPGLRKLGRTTAYGTFDAHFEPGEPVSVRVEDIALTYKASKGNDLQKLGRINGEKDVTAIGNISYLSDYLVVMKNTDGSLRELWTRAEPIKSVPKDKVGKLREEYEAFVA